jgi:small subunit ribosomal protein S6
MPVAWKFSWIQLFQTQEVRRYIEETDMPLYEHVFLARQDIQTAQVDAISAEITATIEEMGGKVTKTEYWGLKNLAYRIKKNRKAHYVLLNVDAPAAALHEVERKERIHDDVLRAMTIRVEELEEGPSAMLRAKDQKDKRGDRGRRR